MENSLLDAESLVAELLDRVEHPADLAVDVRPQQGGQPRVRQQAVVSLPRLLVPPTHLVEVGDVELDVEGRERAGRGVALGQLEMAQAALEVALHFGNDAEAKVDFVGSGKAGVDVQGLFKGLAGPLEGVVVIVN